MVKFHESGQGYFDFDSLVTLSNEEFASWVQTDIDDLLNAYSNMDIKTELLKVDVSEDRFTVQVNAFYVGFLVIYRYDRHYNKYFKTRLTASEITKYADFFKEDL